MYHVGDKVAHPGHGGCVIQGVCDKEFRGETKRYYVLIPSADPNTTILDPVESVRLIGLRDIISAIQADSILASMAMEARAWIKDHTQRRQYYERILKEGELMDIAAMIKEISDHNQNVTLSKSDKDQLQKAKKKLASEIALAKGIAFDDALDLLKGAVEQPEILELS
jgi:CarD family transcriptional regulator